MSKVLSRSIGSAFARAAIACLSAAAFVACGGDDTNNNNPNNNNNNNNKKIKIDSFTANPMQVAVGGTTILSWKVTNATSVEITAAPGGALPSSTLLDGSVTSAAINEATTFTLTAKADGLASVQQTVTVSVDATAVGIQIFEATPNPGELGAMTTLHWKTVNATSIRILDGATEVQTPTTDAEGTKMVTLDRPSTTFKLEATGASGMATRDLVVTATGPLAIHAFTVTPATFMTAPATIAIHWETTGATSLALTQDGTAVAGFSGMAIGDMNVTLNASATFVLRATGDGSETVEETRTVSLLAGAEVEPNDTFGQATAATGSHSGSLGTDTDLDWWSVTVPAGGWVRAGTDDTAGNCDIDTIVTLFDTDGAAELDSNDDRGGGQVCSLLDPAAAAGARNLAGGTYFLRVEGYEGALGDYVFTVEVGSKACGNGIPETGEQCDDGNTAASDGCDASCNIEIIGEVTTVPANQVIAVPLVDDTTVKTIRLVLAQPAYLRAETFVDNAGQPSCPDPIDTLMVVSDSNQTTITGADSGGIGECSKIDPAVDPAAMLEAGTYFLEVRAFNPEGAPDLKLRVELFGPGCGNGLIEENETCDDGNTTAGDGCNATCRPESSQTISAPGGLFPMSFPTERSTVTFALQLTAGQSVTASVTPANAAPDCSPYPRIAFLDSTYAELGADSFGDFERGCTSIEAGRDSFATDLAAGTYYVHLQNSGGTPGALSLNVVIRNAVCGNGILEARSGEQCDDGNTMGGDGCDATCHLAGMFTAEIEPNNDLNTATPSGLAGNPSVVAGGAISPGTDEDWWKITLTAPKTLTAGTHTTLADSAVCATGTDTVLTLYDSAGASITENDDIDTSGGNYCSRIDAASSMGASSLMAGTYYLKVKSYQNRDAIPLYFLTISLQ